MKKFTELKPEDNVNEKDFAIPYRNILYIIAGFAVMVLGYLLMAGGGSDDPQVFNEAMFSFRRIVLAPVLILIGIVGVIVAIMHRGKGNK